MAYGVNKGPLGAMAASSSLVRLLGSLWGL